MNGFFSLHFMDVILPACIWAMAVWWLLSRLHAIGPLPLGGWLFMAWVSCIPQLFLLALLICFDGCSNWNMHIASIFFLFLVSVLTLVWLSGYPRGRIAFFLLMVLQLWWENIYFGWLHPDEGGFAGWFPFNRAYYWPRLALMFVVILGIAVGISYKAWRQRRDKSLHQC